MRVPRNKDSIAAMLLLFVSANSVPDPLAANNADNKETFHMAETNSRNFFLLPIS
jgi:hypothetical protein